MTAPRQTEPKQHLLLHAAPDMRLDSDAFALIVTRGTARPRRFPLERLHLVSISGDLDLPARVLTQLCASGIGVRLHAGVSGQDALLLGLHPRTFDVACDLDDFHDHPDWRRIYVHWRARQDFWGALRALQGRRRLHLGLLRTALPHLRADAIEALHARGWPIHRLRSPYPGINPVRDITRAMAWDAIPLAAQASAGDLVAWHSRHRPILLARAGLAIDALHRLLLESTSREDAP